jgi:hypothetical protein
VAFTRRRRRGGGCSGKNRKREDTFASVAEMFIQRHVARLYTHDAEPRRDLIDIVEGHRQPERQGSRADRRFLDPS